MLCQVPCVTREYVVDWVAQPWQSLDAHVLFKGQVSGALKKAQDDRSASTDDTAEPSADWGAP